jgi:hypothetical protein
MSNDITKRFIECYRELKELNAIKSDRQFCLNLSYSPQSWLKILKGERDVTLDLLKKATEVYEFNPEFLISGHGERLRNREASEEFQAHEEINKTIVHVPVTAKAGYADQLNDPVFARDLMFYSLPMDYYRHGNFRSFEVEGDSMDPVLNSGEIVVCTKLEDQSLWQHNIKTGYVYVVITKNDIVVKRVINLLKAEKTLQLVSDNTSYPDIIVQQEDIYEIWLVKMKISPFAHSRVNLRQEMIENYSELKKTIKNQSEIIVRLNSVVEKILLKNRLQ